MLAVLGFVTILLVLALIMSKKVSTLVALIFVPAITGFIAAFINAPNVIIQAAQAAAEKAGTAYVEPVITFGTRFTKALSILSADYMGKGLSSIVATGVMFIFAILFFSTCSDAGHRQRCFRHGRQRTGCGKGFHHGPDDAGLPAQSPDRCHLPAAGPFRPGPGRPPEAHPPLRMGCICHYGRCGLRGLWAAVLRSHQKKHLPPFSPIPSF